MKKEGKREMVVAMKTTIHHLMRMIFINMVMNKVKEKFRIAMI